MEKEYTCFVISPIGDQGSEVRENADAVLDYLITPALRNCGFQPQNIVRADKFCAAGVISADIINWIRTSDLCIVDATGQNPNVMYECGMRHGTGKPYVMMAQRGEMLPFDIAGLRTVMYDLSSLKSARQSQDVLEQFVTNIVETKFQSEDEVFTINSVVEKLDGIEQKISALLERASSGRVAAPEVAANDNLNEILSKLSPLQAFQYAVETNSMHLAEDLLPKIKEQVSMTDYLYPCVAHTASMGSKVAADILMGNWNYVCVTMDAEQKRRCIGSLVSYFNKSDTEEENLEFVTTNIDAFLKEAEDNDSRAGLYNQKNRIYYGAYVTSGNTKESYLKAASDAIQVAITLNPGDPSYYYNYAGILEKAGNDEAAAQQIEKCLELDTRDEDHLEMAYRLFYKTHNPKADEVYAQLQEVNPYLATITRRNLLR